MIIPNLRNYLSDEQWEHFRQEKTDIFTGFHRFVCLRGRILKVTHTGEAFWIQTRVLKWAGYPKITTVDEYFDLIEAYVQANPGHAGQDKNDSRLPCYADDWRFFCLENVPQFLDKDIPMTEVAIWLIRE